MNAILFSKSCWLHEFSGLVYCEYTGKLRSYNELEQGINLHVNLLGDGNARRSSQFGSGGR